MLNLVDVSITGNHRRLVHRGFCVCENDCSLLQLLLAPTPFVIGIPASFLLYKKNFRYAYFGMSDAVENSIELLQPRQFLHLKFNLYYIVEKMKFLEKL
jgi:hypothetical protein